MAKNRDRLRRTTDGHYEVGVYIEKDKYARFVAKVLVPYDAEAATHLAMTLDPEPTFELAATAAHSWAQERIPANLRFRPGGSRDYAAQDPGVREGAMS